MLECHDIFALNIDRHNRSNSYFRAIRLRLGNGGSHCAKRQEDSGQYEAEDTLSLTIASYL